MNTTLGRPPLYTEPAEVDAIAEAYFAKCEEEKRPFTMSGLALALGMTRASLVNYGKSEVFFESIQRAKSICEAYTEEHLHTNTQVAGLIFSLKNNYDWKDQRGLEHSGPDGGPIEMAKYTDAELEDIIRKSKG
jgi:hypothetical protein